ncbi:MAG TPA: ABC transporter substrate-binding protein [Cyanobacteria bacterium UBA11372]|nr:ABC transporter substrate-binding protein [Cyanobacteria bacterium UBA11372]HBE36483.1 ABC transporter substrate-binding protein [Cyanobacteria bacterium UBA11368]
MTKRVIFRIETGDFNRGFPITLEIRENGKLCAPEVSGTLVEFAEIPTLYQEWKQAYYAWGQDENCRWWRRQIDVPPTIVTHASENSEDRVRNAADKFEQAFNKWLKLSSLEDIQWTLSQTVRGDEFVSFIVQTNHSELQKLPWELWRSLSQRYDNFEVALSIRRVPIRKRLSVPVKILVILGSDENIDIQTDWEILEKTLPGAKLTLLKQPNLGEFKEKLRNQPWDIVFFAGHSATHPEENDARIWLNDQTSLSPQNIERDLQKAVKNGLKVAIFNSCDGLGLARQLEKLQIPHIIVMREPVHDRVAQKFLEHFLNSFAKGKSLQQAVCEARENLRDLEDSSPNASWLPVIFQNPEEPPLVYPKSPFLNLLKQLLISINRSKKLAIWGMGSIALFTLAFVIFPRFQGMLKPDSGRRSIGNRLLIQANANLDKQKGVEAFAKGDYKQAIAHFKSSLIQQPNDPETLIYLNNAQAIKNYLKIAVSVPIGSNLNVSQEILRGVATAQDEINQKGGINGKKLQVEIVNDENNTNIAQKVAQELVKDRAVLGVVGHNASNASLAAAPIYQKGGLVMISPTSTANNLSGSGNYIFRTVLNTKVMAEALSDYAVNKARKTKIVFCYDSQAPDNVSFKDEFLAAFVSKGGKFVPIVCDLSTPNFDPTVAVTGAINSGADGLFILSHIDRLQAAVSVAKANQNRLALFSNSNLYTIKTLETGQQAVKGLALVAPWHPQVNPSFAETIAQKWRGKVGWRSATAYDATGAIIAGLQQGTGRDRLQQTLHSPGFTVPGATGAVTFTPSGDRIGNPVIIQVQSNGSNYEFALVKD